MSGRPNVSCAGARPGSGARGFTLVELLVVIAIMAILMSLILPTVGRVKARAVQTGCASNLRQVSVVCLTFAADNGGLYPTCNSANPATFRIADGTKVDLYMKQGGFKPDIWYCPVLDDPMATPKEWMTSGAGKAPISGNEFRIGYFYVGCPSSDSQGKFLKPFPLRRTVSAETALIFDYCCTWGMSETLPGNQVP
jgi:prepilin-type N-terminal cleavage/methylation domain-containing protein